MASEDSENKTTHIEAAQPEKKPKPKARSQSRKAKPGAKKAAKKEETPDVQHTENRQESTYQAAPVKPEEAPVAPASANDPAPVSEKPAKKKGKPRGRKPKARPKAEEHAQPATAEPVPSAGHIPEQTEGVQKTNPAAEPSAPAQAVESAKAAEEVKRPKAKKRGRPKKPKPAPEAPQLAAPQPAAENTSTGQPGHEPDADKAEGAGQAKDKDEEILPAASEEKKKPKSKRRGKSRKKKPKQVIAEEEGSGQDGAMPTSAQEHTAEPASVEEEAAMPETAAPITPEPVLPKPVVPKREPPLVVVASGNPAKIKAVELAFARMFPDEKFDFEGMSVASGVSDQPMSDDETFAGAYMRAQACRESRPEATYWIGLEGGLEEIGDELHAFAWMVVFGPEELMGKSRTATFVLPPTVAELILVEGKELGEADDLVFGQTNSKESSGAVGILTHGLLDRANYYAQALVLALVPFKNPHLYRIEQAEAVEA